MSENGTGEAKDFDRGDGARGKRLTQNFEFKLGGETFRLRNGVAVGSTALDQWRDVYRRLSTPDEERDADYVKCEDDEFLDAFRNTMRAILAPGQDAAFDRILSENAQEPLMIPDCFEVVYWAVGVVTGRPTDASPPSSNGSTTPTTEPAASSSTDDSSSPEPAESNA